LTALLHLRRKSKPGEPGFEKPFDEASKDLAEAKKKTGAEAPVFGTAMRA